MMCRLHAVILDFTYFRIRKCVCHFSLKSLKETDELEFTVLQVTSLKNTKE